MAKSSAAYCHPRLGMVTTVPPPASGGCINNITIITIPRGAMLDVKSGLITVDGSPAAPDPFEPFSPTPELAALPAPIEPEPEVEEIEPEADGKIERLDSWRRRSGDDGPTGAA